MSQSDAESSKLVVGLAKFIPEEEIEKEDRGIKIDLIGPQNRRKIKGHLAENVTNCSEIVEDISVTSTVEDKDEDEAKNSSQLSDPEVILNEDVIYEIAKYLNFKDLKSLRQVNNLWSAGATRQFLKNSVIFLDYKQRSRSEDQLNAFGAETENLKGIKTLRISHPCFYKSEKETEIFRDIIATLAPNVKALELEFSGDYIFWLMSPIHFPAASSLTLKECSLNIYTCRLLYASAPNITELVIEGDTSDVLSPLLSDDRTRNWSLAPKLKSLTMSVCPHIDYEGFWNSPPLDLTALDKLPQKWERLDITLDYMNENDSKALNRLLEKNKDSLVRLKLKIAPWFIIRHPTLFPAAFSKLEKLELDFELLYFGSISFGSSGSGLNFSKNIPTLKSLSVKLPNSVVRSERTTGIWASLFPPQVFRGLKYLKVEGMSFIAFPNDQEIPGDWAQKMFPNACVEIS